MIVFVRHSMRDLRRIWRQILLFESLYIMATSLLFVPALTFLLNRLLLAPGVQLLLNADVYKLALSFRGLAAFGVIGFAAGLVAFLEFGTVIVLAQQRLFGRDCLVSDAFVTAARAVPRLLGLGFIQWVLALFTFSPWVDTPLASLMLDWINVPIAAYHYWHESKALSFLYAAMLLALAYLFLRSIFALHYVLLERQTTAQAIQSSFRLTRTKKGRLLVTIAAINSALYAVAYAVLAGASFTLERWELPVARFILSDWYVPITSLLALGFAMLAVPINLLVLTRLFYVFRRMDGVPPADQLQLYRSERLRKAEAAGRRYFRTRSVRYSFALFIVAYAAGVLALHQTYGDRLVYLDWNVKVIGHRGDVYRAPENSLSGIRSAIEGGVDAVEIDVQLSKDGVVVLNHDFTLERVAGIPASVHELTMAELQQLDIRGVWTGMPPERIPTLAEALREARGRTKLVVEIKPYGDKETLARTVVEWIEAEEMEEDVYVQSFDSRVLRIVREENPDLKIGQILFAAAGDVAALDVDFYTINQTMLSERFIRRAHKLDREVWVWTVNVERNMREVLRYDVDAVITDYPEKLRSLVGVRE
ncbi:glycerophosphodiester phosphodiesterase family protein [Paenibacillus sp.]|uniref:glycerophosphodiester phosphodiesterase family protein n=1 Tax=Paenibacillus sp. TaxID=58172 RepID=UPI002D31FA87|nr:glycerophosphodiester phosphodiesterase family protein [Paenibacillus sp.]HZG86670.1 glycerophosphodiester phosphodiesterase family protein [Paenibacillus sp.]